MKHDYKIAFLLTQSFWFDGEKYTTRYPFVLYIIAMALHVKELVLFVPLKNSIEEHGDFIVNIPDNVTIIPCPFFFSLKQLYLNSFTILPGYFVQFFRYRRLFDILGLLDTSIVSFLAFVFFFFFKC
jgi:hypothetical protein